MSALRTKPPVSLGDEIDQVLRAGLCVGCGACAVRRPDAVIMRRDGAGAMQAVLTDPAAAADTAPGICPFSDASDNEDTIGARIFGAETPADPRLGRVRRSYAGHVAEGGYRAAASSGGMATWFLTEAMQAGMIDAVVHVHPAQAHPARGAALFDFAIARTPEEIRAGAKSRYYSVSFDQALRKAVAQHARVAFVGVPCFVKAVHLLAQADPAIRAAVALRVAIICGHMKSAGFAESLAWQVGVRPNDIAAVDFRVKHPGQPAKLYGFSATAQSTGQTREAPMARLAGRRWDGGYFRLEACDYCDDVVGETADISFGDAWLPEYDHDPGGTNVVILRDPRLEPLIEAARDRGALALDDLTADRAAASQSGGFRDRREALAYRLWRAGRSGQWHPQKRVTPGAAHLTRMRRLIYRLRQIVRQRSYASLRLSKAVGSILPYRIEMTFWHKLQAVTGLVEHRTRR